ncbi:MAG: hypothetical protein ACYC8T_26640, partial [Myxococcaceae bacterium]
IAVGGAEMIFRAFVHLRLACDLADLVGRSFRANEPADLSRLCALLYRAPRNGDAHLLHKDGLERWVPQEYQEPGARVGAKLMREAFARNVLPFVNLVTSTAANYRRTHRFGMGAYRYARHRRAIDLAATVTQDHWDGARDLVLTGAWFLLSSEGELEPEVSSALLHYLAAREPADRSRLAEAFTANPARWLAELQQAPVDARDPLWQALLLVAAAEGEIAKPRRELLHRVASALGGDRAIEAAEVILNRMNALDAFAPPPSPVPSGPGPAQVPPTRA